MHLDQVIYDHAEWKNRFRAAVLNHQHLDVAMVSSEACCDLGNWLHGDGVDQFGHLPAYLSLIQSHRHFHQEAGRVAGLINAMAFPEAEAELEYGSAYSRAAQDVAIAIMSLHEALQREKGNATGAL
jgi:hypothetical protein